MGVCREQNNKQEQETQSAYQLSLHLLPLPSSSKHSFFLTGYNCGSALIYHTEELNVDTTKYFQTQGSPGACVFSLFKMERANPSLDVCDWNRSHEEHSCICACLFEKASRYASTHMCSAYACLSTYTPSVICTCTGVRCTVEIRGHSNAFSASKYHDWNIYCLRTFDKSCFSAAFEPTENLQKTSQMLVFSEHVIHELHWLHAQSIKQ